MPIVLTSSDGVSFEINEAVAIQSQIISSNVEEYGTNIRIRLPNVTSKILLKVIEYCRRHVENPDDAAVDDLNTFDTKFVKVDRDTLYDLMMAAYYLNIKSLLDLTCQTFADMIKGKNPVEICKILGIEMPPEDPEETERIRREFPWAFSNGNPNGTGAYWI